MINVSEFEGNASTTLHMGNTRITFAMSTFSIAAMLLGIPGNILIIHAVRCRKQMQNAKNFFIASLACSDIVALLVSTPFSTLNFGHLLRHMPEAVCKSIVPTGCVVMIISVYTHVAIAYERRRAIVFPLLPKPSPRIIKTFITIIWLVPAFVIGPTIYHISRVFQRQFCTFSFLIGPGEVYARAFFATGTALSFFIPIGVLIWSYRQIICTLKQNTAAIEELAETNAAVALRLKNQRKVVNSLIVLVCAFVTLSTPFSVLCLLWFVGYEKMVSSASQRYRLVTSSIYYMVYALNPVILYISSNEYRLAFNETFKVWKNILGRIFSCCSNGKSLNKKRSKAFPSVIVLSVTKA